MLVGSHLMWDFLIGEPSISAHRAPRTIDTSSRRGKLVMGILALIAEFENDIRCERQMDGIGLLGGMEWSGPAIGTFTYVNFVLVQPPPSPLQRRA
jgi:hypothetical protein